MKHTRCRAWGVCRLSLAMAGLLLVQGLMTGAAANAADLELRSGPGRTSLLELYTSEGCSSCPPADRWLSELVGDDRVWDDVVPVAFHVDYWDYIGWKDRFATKAFSQRQRAYRRHGGVRSVYTPGFVLAGEEWRSWFGLPVLRVPSAPDPGVLKVRRSGDRVEVAFEPTAVGRGESPRVHVAVLGFEIATMVKAGENDGRRLRHDFVVIGYDHKSLAPSKDALTATLTLPKATVQAPRTALAVWISHADDPRPVQAVGGWM